MRRYNQLDNNLSWLLESIHNNNDLEATRILESIKNSDVETGLNDERRKLLADCAIIAINARKDEIALKILDFVSLTLPYFEEMENRNAAQSTLVNMLVMAIHSDRKKAAENLFPYLNSELFYLSMMSLLFISHFQETMISY